MIGSAKSTPRLRKPILRQWAFDKAPSSLEPAGHTAVAYPWKVRDRMLQEMFEGLVRSRMAQPYLRTRRHARNGKRPRGAGTAGTQRLHRRAAQAPACVAKWIRSRQESPMLASDYRPQHQDVVGGDHAWLMEFASVHVPRAPLGGVWRETRNRRVDLCTGI
jgi:hypothetical protein